ncbi:MAG: hypothetical protein WAP74_00620 [Patescibacteria group bacterium]
MTDVDNQIPAELQDYDHWDSFKISVVGSLTIFCYVLFTMLALRNKWAASNLEREQAAAEVLIITIICSVFGVLLFMHSFDQQIPGLNYGVVAGQGFCITLLVAGWWFQALTLPAVPSDAACYLILMGEIVASACLVLCLGRFVINANVLGLSRLRVLLWLMTQAILESSLVYLIIARSLFAL